MRFLDNAKSKQENEEQTKTILMHKETQIKRLIQDLDELKFNQNQRLSEIFNQIKEVV